MAKKKSHEELKAALEEAQSSLKSAKSDLKEFMAENKIKKGTEVADVQDKKTRKAYESLVNSVDKFAAQVEKYSAEEKEARPAKARASKYEYPDDVVTKEDRKKWRTKMRNQANGKSEKAGKKAKSEKPEAAGKAEKSGKTSKKEKAGKAKKKSSSKED